MCLRLNFPYVITLRSYVYCYYSCILLVVNCIQSPFQFNAYYESMWELDGWTIKVKISRAPHLGGFLLSTCKRLFTVQPPISWPGSSINPKRPQKRDKRTALSLPLTPPPSSGTLGHLSQGKLKTNVEPKSVYSVWRHK